MQRQVCQRFTFWRFRSKPEFLFIVCNPRYHTKFTISSTVYSNTEISSTAQLTMYILSTAYLTMYISSTAYLTMYISSTAYLTMYISSTAYLTMYILSTAYLTMGISHLVFSLTVPYHRTFHRRPILFHPQLFFS